MDYVKLFPNVASQKLSKSANAAESYSKNKSSMFFIETRCTLITQYHHHHHQHQQHLSSFSSQLSLAVSRHLST